MEEEKRGMVRMNWLKPLLPSLTAAVLSGCLSDPSVPHPIIQGDPVLVHTGANLVLVPYHAMEESI